MGSQALVADPRVVVLVVQPVVPQADSVGVRQDTPPVALSVVHLEVRLVVSMPARPVVSLIPDLRAHPGAPGERGGCNQLPLNGFSPAWYWV